MKRGKIKALQESVWFRPVEEDALELKLVPSEASSAHGELGGATDPVVKARRVCSRAFIDFRGYTEDDGAPVKNSLEARIELYGVPTIGRAVDAELFALAHEAVRGEPSPPETRKVGPAPRAVSGG